MNISSSIAANELHSSKMLITGESMYGGGSCDGVLSMQFFGKTKTKYNLFFLMLKKKRMDIGFCQMVFLHLLLWSFGFSALVC